MKSDVRELKKLEITPRLHGELKEIAQWTKFLSIVGFFFVALLMIIGVFAGSVYKQLFDELSRQSGVNMGLLISALYLVFAIVYFFPILFLFKFAKHLKIALQTKENTDLENSFEKLKSHYKFIGVLTIITLSLYALALVAGIMGLF